MLEFIIEFRRQLYIFGKNNYEILDIVDKREIIKTKLKLKSTQL